MNTLNISDSELSYFQMGMHNELYNVNKQIEELEYWLSKTHSDKIATRVEMYKSNLIKLNKDRVELETIVGKLFDM